MVRSALILGCGRSGTSIFGELFATFPSFRYLSEPYLDECRGLAVVGPVAVKVPRPSDPEPRPSGCSVTVQEVEDVIGEAPVVFWSVRHPLDAVCSLRIGIAQDWGHHPRPLDWKQWRDRALVEQCAHHWAVINSDGYRSAGAVIVNRFEDMIADPRRVGLATAAAVGVAANDLGPTFDAWVDRVQDTNNERFVEAETSRRHSRPDHERRVGRWRENLTDHDLDLVVPIVAGAVEPFGYQLPTHPTR